MLTLAIGAIALQLSQPISVRIDPRVELLSCIFRLQGAMEFNQSSSKSPYSDRVDAYFRSAKDHPAVKMASKLRDESGIGFDSVPWLAVHITDALNPKLIPGNHPDDWKRTWKPKDVEKFLPLLADFARDTNFAGFLKSEDEYYRKATQSMESLLRRRPVGEWLKGFYGNAPNKDSYVIVGLLTGGANYGVSFRHLNDTVDMTPVLGAGEFDSEGIPVYSDDNLGLILHEFSHAYVNPVVAQRKDFIKLGAPLFRLTKSTLALNAYGDVQVMLFETFTRAAENAILRIHYPQLVEVNMLEHRSQGFLWESDITDALVAESGSNAPLSERIAKLQPVLERLYKNPKLILERCPKLKSLTASKPDSEGQVTIHLEFDRPMQKTSRGLVITPDTYEVTKKTVFASDGKSLDVTFRFKKPGRYDFFLNKFSRGYSSESGYPLQQVRKSYTFPSLH